MIFNEISPSIVDKCVVGRPISGTFTSVLNNNNNNNNNNTKSKCRKVLGITFDSQLNFKKHFEEILDRCNTRYHRLRLLVNKKWGPSPATLIQIYKQCVRPIFEYGSLSTITASDYIISQIQRLQNKFIRLALRLPKYICTKLLHDSTGLPYVKDRLLSCATKSLDRIAQNPLVEESISHNRLNPAWDRFPTPLSVVRPGQSSA